MEIKGFAQLLEQILDSPVSYQRVAKNYLNPKNVNPEICKECGGQCCKRCGCNFSPDDFQEISFEYLRQQMEKGYISIDYVDGETFYRSWGVYILRVRNQERPIVDTEYVRRTPCVLWTEKGCKLDYEHRPSSGRLMIPSKKIEKITGERICPTSYSTKQCCDEWRPYQDVLRQLRDYFQDKDFPCSL